MRISSGPELLELWRSLRAPTLREVHKELLGFDESSNRRSHRLAACDERRMSDLQAAQIRDVLSQGQLAIEVNSVRNRIRRVLIDDACSLLIKLLRDLGRPPIVEIADLV